MESRTTTSKEALQARIIAPVSVSTSTLRGEEEKTNPPLAGPFHDESRDLQDGEDLHLPGNVERWYLAAFFWVMIVCGWSDGTTGPLVPRMQEYFDIGYTVVSLVFVCVCIGRLGEITKLSPRDVYTLPISFQLIAYVLLAAPTPYPVFCIGFVLSGIGAGTVQCLATAFLMKLHRNQNLKQCLCQACYGLGALVSPLIATQFSVLPHRWRLHYLSSLGLAGLSFALILFAFRASGNIEDLSNDASSNANANAETWSKMTRIMRNRAVHALAMWAFLYTGTEVSLGGWIVTFLQEVRGGSASAGYASTGFWGGLTIGRLCFIWINQKVGERRIVFAYALIAIGLDLVAWFVPTLMAGAVATSFIGLCLGPMFPIMLSVARHSIPHEIASGSVAWIQSFGQVGSAMLPFTTGVLAQAVGIEVLQPATVTMLATMTLAWAAVLWFTRRSAR
ncbi:hypothetical protein FFLO_03868 [Filobasidium floriforme]|uniref:MFS general substrate transporter n=1 Tax=Filobasidium floriforme TaxID=5210 RepID=A0A8K0JJU5_9TREE|nr:hypothetical protein FFLO_03868 [Filobasidium floriforme]